MLLRRKVRRIVREQLEGTVGAEPQDGLGLRCEDRDVLSLLDGWDVLPHIGAGFWVQSSSRLMVQRVLMVVLVASPN